MTWATVRGDYSIGTVYTLPSQRGRGLAKKAMALISKQIVDLANSNTMRPFSLVAPNNETSIHMHTSIGYQFVHSFFYIKC